VRYDLNEGSASMVERNDVEAVGFRTSGVVSGLDLAVAGRSGALKQSAAVGLRDTPKHIRLARMQVHPGICGIWRPFGRYKRLSEPRMMSPD
jgi:hypothetical protein